MSIANIDRQKDTFYLYFYKFTGNLWVNVRADQILKTWFGKKNPNDPFPMNSR